MKKMNQKNKRIAKRIIALSTVLALTMGVIPMPQIIEDAKESLFNKNSVITAYAISNPTISSIEDLNAFVSSYTAANANDTITIQCTDKLTIPYDFPGIGTDAAPFEGQIVIMNVMGDNGGASRYLQLRAPLFNYISDKATIVDANLDPCTLYLYPDALDSGTFDKPLFANHVAGTGGTASWKIKVNDTDVTANDGAGAIKINPRSSIIGELYNKTSAPNITIEYTNQSTAINGSDDLGLICNTINSGSLSLSLLNGAEAISISGVGNVGGLVGAMNENTTLTINSSLNFSAGRTIETSGGYAGGLVGSCKGTVSFGTSCTYSDNCASTTITGTIGAGGLYGLRETTTGFTINLDDYTITTALSSDDLPGAGIKTTSSSSNVGGLIGKLVNKGTDSTSASITISGSNISSNPKIETSLWADQNSSNGGGLIGNYHSYSLKNALSISDIYVKSSGIKVKEYYGGLIGKTTSEENCGAYVSISDIKSYINFKILGVATQHNLNAKSSALVCYSDYSFIDISESITPLGYCHTALLYEIPSGVVRLAGTTDLSQVTETTSYIATNRGNTLIYALGNGNDANWTYKRFTSIVDDVNPWGQVVRLVSSTAGATNNTQTLQDASVVTVDSTNHTVTLSAAVKNMTSSADFAKTALNIQLNTTGNNFGALCFTTGTANQSGTLLSEDLTISNNISLAGSGITGFTRDDGTNSAFTGTLKPSGGNYTITLSSGEAYGQKNDGTAASTGTNLSGSNLVSSNSNTGAIVSHSYNGLFAKLGNCTIGDDTNTLTLSGNITVCATSDKINHNIGGLAASMTGAVVEIKKIITSETINLSAAGTECVGLLIGNVATNNANTNTLDITSCSMNGTTNVLSKNARIGFIGRVEDSNITITAYDITLSGDINYKGGGRPYAGGFAGELSSNTSDSRNLILEDVVIDGLTVSTDISSATTGVDSPAGGLLGGQWNNTNVYIGAVIGSDTTISGVAVTDGALTLTEYANCVGGLVSNATGYWQVNKLDVTQMTVSGATNALGVMVLKGTHSYNNVLYGLYLEITSPNAYTISDDVTSDTPTIYDELIAFSKNVDSSLVANEGNGQGIISYHTANYSDATKLSMATGAGNDNSYQPQTALGSNHNPYSRYYYNLDYILKNNSTGGEKLLLWSVYQYAAGNIKSNTAIGTANTHSFSDYSDLATLLPDGTTCDLSNLSYYPVDITSPLTLEGLTVVLHNTEMQAAHGTTYNLNGVGTQTVNSQHFLMHASLFKDVKADLSLTNTTLQGSVADHGAANGLDSGSGAIICGVLSGASPENKTTLTIDELVLDGIKVNDNTGALIVKSISSNTIVNISNVSTTNSYNSGSTTPIAADYLIGDAAGSAMTLNFSNMVLDARKTTSDLYNPSASSSSENSKEKTAADLNTAYNTFSSIFGKSTFLNSLNYETGAASAKYDYTWSEDWGTTKHQVTYAKELSLSTSEYYEEEYKYSDRYNGGDGVVYTSPESNNLTENHYDFSCFIPHVYTPYNNSTNYHEVAVNIVDANLTSGCGTYNDPYIVDADQMTVVAKVLNGDISNGFYLYIDNDYGTSNINFEKWCTNKNKHTKYIYNSGNGIFEKENQTSSTKTIDNVQRYLAGAYYEIDGNITLGSKFLGLGGSTNATAFRGVIVGKQQTNGSYPVISNGSTNPLIKVSNGSVIKNVGIEVTAENIVLSTDLSGTSSTDAKFGYATKMPFYGAVIGEIMGGDNIIDNVQVTFEGNGTTSTLITVGGTGECDIPVGAYVGVLVNGSLIFRTMTAALTNTTNTKFHVYKSTDSGKTNPLEGDISINSNGVESIKNLYVNPIIGRVINGVAINETTAYRFSEDGKYVDANSQSRSADRTAAANQVTLKNGRKNYSIPDINKNNDAAANATAVSNSQSPLILYFSGDTYKNISVPDAQALFILSAICQMNAGSANNNTSGTDQYNTGNDSGYKGNSNATHLALYTDIGTPSSTKPDDFTVVKLDLANDTTQTPYIIYKYTNSYSTTISNKEYVKYPARRITRETPYTITLSATSGTTYYLPDSFRGIGYIGGNTLGKSADDKTHNFITVSDFSGNGNIIDVNSYFRSYESSFDNYFGEKDTGIALFNTVNPGTTTASNGVPTTTNGFRIFTLQGYISAKRVNSSNAIASTDNTKKFWRVGGIIAYDNGKTFDFENISFVNLNLDGSFNTGALIGYTSGGTSYINNCSANKLKVSGSNSIGGLIGDPTKANIYHNTKSNAFSSYKLYVQLIESNQTVLYSGGLFGEHTDGTNWIKNADIIGWCGAFNNDSTLGSLIGRSTNLSKGYNESGDKVTFCTGGVLGQITGGTTIIDNINLFGMNVYGCASAGIVGDVKNDLNVTIMNCGIHGSSSNNISVTEGTYYIKSDFYSGGIVGYSHSTEKGNDTTDTPATFSSNGKTYSKGIYNVYVNNYTFEATREAATATVGGVLGLYRNRKVINNAKVDNCTFITNGRYANRMGGLVGGATRYNLFATNISITNNSFSPTPYNNTSNTTYGLIYGGKAGIDPVQVFVTGYTSYGNTTNVSFGSAIISDGSNRPVEFDLGRPTTYPDLYSNLIQVGDTYYDIPGGMTITIKPTYIIYSDYKSSSKDLTSGVLSNIVGGSSVSNVPMRSITTTSINNVNHLFFGSQVDTETSATKNDIFPYVTSTPVAELGNKILTGDGIWCQKNDDNLKLMADEIISDRNTAVTNGTHDATIYMNFPSSDITTYEQLKADGKISTYNTEQGSDLLPTDIPVIVVDDTRYDYTSAIRAYIRILTNTNYVYDTTTGYENLIYRIDVLKCNYDSGNETLTVSSSNKTFDINNTGAFYMSSSSYDSATAGQFSLIDVQFYDPANRNSKVAYHLYIPVYTKKAFNFKFGITALSGSSYYSSDYTNSSHFAGLNSSPSTRNEASNIVVENYSTPVTMYLRYEYDMDDIINEILGGGYGLNWNYNKALDFIYNYSNDNALPYGTKFVLIDANQRDKGHYSTGFVPSPYADLDINPSTFPAYSVNGNNYAAYSVISFRELMEKRGITLNATLLDAASLADAQAAGIPIFHAEATDSSNQLQFEASGVTSGKSLVLATTSGDGNDIETGTELYTITASSSSLYEDYYLTIIAPSDDGDVLHQVNVKSKVVLEYGSNIKATCEKNDSVILMFANMFTKTVNILTIEDDDFDKEMSTNEKNDINIRAVTSLAFNSSGLGDQLNEVRRTLNNRDVEIYHSTHLQFIKIEADNTQQNTAVDGVTFSLNSSPSESANNYLYNNGVYARMADGTTGVDIFYSADTETTDRYKRVVSCTDSNTDFSGSRVTNYYETINKDNGNLINLRPYLTGESFGDNTAHEVKIVSNFKMTFNPNGIMEQFAIREGSSEAGTIVKGLAALAYQEAGTTYSNNTSELIDSTPVNRKYYRKDASKTSLRYNVVTDSTLASANAKTKTNSVLGINPFDEYTQTRSSISSWGNYDASQLAGADTATSIKWTLSLYRRQKNVEINETTGLPEETGEEYGSALPINDYLKSIKFFGINSDATKGSEITLTSSTSTELTYIAPRGSFEDITLRNNPDDSTEKTNRFISYVDYDVITGTELETATQFYSNYKVILTAELVGDASSKASDHIIYTNARLDPSFIDKKAS